MTEPSKEMVEAVAVGITQMDRRRDLANARKEADALLRIEYDGEIERWEANLELDQLRSELQRIAEGRMTLDSIELLTWAEGWLLSLQGGPL